MAFRQPQQRPQARRQSRPAVIPVADVAAGTAAVDQTQQRSRPVQESQEWILFSPTPSVAPDDQQSVTSRTSLTRRTTNFSRLSEIGSLETGLRSDQYGAQGDEDLTCQGTEIEDDEDEEAEELDSLDDGLHAFQAPISPLLDQSGGTVLPMHDGLGSFSHAVADGTGMQEHLWQFERYNPHRRRAQRRRSSVQKRMDAFEEEEGLRGLDKGEERRLRIEKWRLEQGRAVLEEIERETRRRQRRMSMGMSVASGAASTVAANVSPIVRRDTLEDHLSTHDEALELEESESESESGSESFWQRITRRVIKDLMGLDETTLSVIFGEELAPEASASATPTQSSPIAMALSNTNSLQTQSWERRLLERIARELGILADQLSAFDGNAFSTYSADAVAVSAGAPAQLATTTTLPIAAGRDATARLRQQSFDTAATPLSDALFQPTLPNTAFAATTTTDPSLWGIEEEELDSSNERAAAAAAGPALPKGTDTNDQYWEQDLDIGVIFRYLRNRFSSSHHPSKPAIANAPAPPSTSATDQKAPLLPADWASTPAAPGPAPLAASALGTSPESLRRADLIRRHHPLVSHAASVSASRRRESLMLLRRHQQQHNHHHHHSLLLQHHHHQRRSAATVASSSCASQSTKRTHSGSSRRYWDFPSGGAGVAAGGSGSAVSVTSGGYENMMGSWGEV